MKTPLHIICLILVLIAPAGARTIIHSPRQAAQFVHPTIGHLPHEEAHILFVDGDGHLLGVTRITQYYEDGVFLAPWEFAFGDRTPPGTKKIYITHNHPNNNPNLSQGDIQVGSYWHHRVAPLGIQLDLLAVTHSRGYTSLLESGQLLEPRRGLAGIWDHFSLLVSPFLGMFRPSTTREVLMVI